MDGYERTLLWVTAGYAREIDTFNEIELVGYVPPADGKE